MTPVSATGLCPSLPEMLCTLLSKRLPEDGPLLFPCYKQGTKALHEWITQHRAVLALHRQTLDSKPDYNSPDLSTDCNSQTTIINITKRTV